MKNKVRAYFLIPLALAGLWYVYDLLFNPLLFFESSYLKFEVVQPLMQAPQFLFASFFLVFIFIKALKPWFYFSAFYIPISVILVANVPPFVGASILVFDRFLTARLLGFIYVFITILIVLFVYIRIWWKGRTQKQEKV